jgi:hypothetical protein
MRQVGRVVSLDAHRLPLKTLALKTWALMTPDW